MTIRSVTLAYVVPPVLALVLAFIGVTQVGEAGLIGASSTVTATAGPETGSNQRVAAALDRVARVADATIVRVVADRAAPTTRRVALVTDAPASRGERWLQDGYADFSRSMTTHVRPMQDLDQFDPTGTYDVFGDDRARRAAVQALTEVGYAVTSERVPLLQRVGVVDGVDRTAGLIVTLTLGCSTLCVMGTSGSLRRSAVRRLHGRSTASIVRSELAEARTSVLAIVIAAPCAAIWLWMHNGLADVTTFGTAFVILCGALLAPVAVAHALGTIGACRVPMVDALRGARPAGALLVVVHAARLPALLVLVAASFDLVGAVAVVRSGSAERDLRAAGETMQLWVTPDPRPVDTQPYWDRIGAFAGRALDRGDALLAAPVEVSTGQGGATAPALFVDAGYLDRQDVRAEDGTRLAADAPGVSVWLPAHSTIGAGRLVQALSGWELRDAPAATRAHITVGRLAAQEVYSYPGDSTSRTWLDDAVLVVVPDPAAAFSADQLGSWLSSGDVVFGSRSAAERAIRTSDVGREFSAVVDVGQVAAEAARQAARTVGIGVAGVVSAVIVSAVLAGLGAAAHRRRYGRAHFARIAAGTSFLRANASLLVIEVVLVTVATVAAINTWWDLHPDGAGMRSALDPVAQTAGVAVAFAAGMLVLVGTVSATAIATTAKTVARTRGNGS
ncbi:hypothetical protein BIV03_13545 [Curtobacterium sp. MCBA15_016]|uniref:hypothetical protein n=1 Tax=Curtobacterium sp. MCBA15_016 TaxID=1898740 RepID=UPI0008DD3B1D|nr:hypothetical protein [Curtobacterium sp. MCBA15_016]OII22198.1 hypothetical protein BIV03_13545 [Curtobacterium sp. MCBA15_016]